MRGFSLLTYQLTILRSYLPLAAARWAGRDRQGARGARCPRRPFAAPRAGARGGPGVRRGDHARGGAGARERQRGGARWRGGGEGMAGAPCRRETSAKVGRGSWDAPWGWSRGRWAMASGSDAAAPVAAEGGRGSGADNVPIDRPAPLFKRDFGAGAPGTAATDPAGGTRGPTTDGGAGGSASASPRAGLTRDEPHGRGGGRHPGWGRRPPRSAEATGRRRSPRRWRRRTGRARRSARSRTRPPRRSPCCPGARRRSTEAGRWR